MRHIMLSTFAALCLTQTASATTMEHYFKLPSSQSIPQSVLYIQTSAKAVLKQTDAKNGVYQLTLQQVNPMVTFFSDRPTRVEGQIGNAAYLQTWNQGGKNSFDKDAPNAVVSGVASIAGQSKNVNIVMELSNPVLSMKNQTITYTAKSLSSSESKLGTDGASLNYASVFIDGGVCTTCIIGG